MVKEEVSREAWKDFELNEMKIYVDKMYAKAVLGWIYTTECHHVGK